MMSILDKFRLDGKVALVTGASRGLGQAMAVGLAEAGADVAGLDRTPDCAETCDQVERARSALYEHQPRPIRSLD